MTDASAASIQPAPRSTFVTVLAWLGILLFSASALMFGAEGILFRPLLEQTATWQMSGDSLKQMSPEAAQASAAMMPWFFAILVAVLLLGVVASIGLLNRRNWGRIIIIVFLALNTVGALFGVLGGLIMGSIPVQAPTSGFPSGPEFEQLVGAARILMIAGSAVVALICGWLIYKLLSRAIRAEFMTHAA